MARQARGMKGALLLAFESEFGVTPTLPEAYRIPFNANTLTAKQSLIDSNTITGRRDPVEPGMGQIDVSGNLTEPLDVRNIGVALTLMFGEPVTTGSSAPYTHVWTIKDDMPSATIEKGFGDLGKYAVYPGCKVSKFSLSAAVGNNETTYGLDIMGADETLENESLTETPVVLDLLRFNNFQAAVMEGGIALGTCRKMDLNIDFGLDGDTYCLNGSGRRTDIAEGIVQVTGNIEALFNNTTLLEKAISGTETSLKLTFTRAAHSLEFLIPELIYERNTPTIDGPKGLLQSLPFRGFYSNNSDNSAVKVTLKNDVASYALPE